ncbi:MAG: ABC transporter ATP-binding protein [Chloroflexota bacterium]|nr:ABC transporter ATP-binding protein [Anaerolineae bacterium]HMM27225.1 ABC transporter ATP-binding protein [Aggregatilineaceae bacterium]
MSIARTEALTKVYGAVSQPIYALNDVNLMVEEGEFLAIMGPSGSGKSTLLYLLGGLDRPTSGTVYLRDTDLSTLDDNALSRLRRQSLGFVFQFFNLVPVLSAQENVAIPLILDGVPRAGALKRASDALARVGLADRATHRPSELSGGEQQRVALARALVAQPAVILADEPTGNLDSRSSDEMVQTLRETVDAWGQTLILVTHDPRVAAYADRIVFLKDGKIVDDNRLKGQSSAEQIREQLSRVAVS